MAGDDGDDGVLDELIDGDHEVLVLPEDVDIYDPTKEFE